MRIKISYTESGLFGVDADTEGVDVFESKRRYEREVVGLLQAEFPDAEIEVSEGVEERTIVDPEDYESPDTTVEIGEILHRHWEQFGWVEA